MTVIYEDYFGFQLYLFHEKFIRLCVDGFVEMEDTEFEVWKPPQHWHPHQLRHNAATFLRKEFGLETARIILGHRSAAITEVYAELDQQKALEAIVRVG